MTNSDKTNYKQLAEMMHQAFSAGFCAGTKYPNIPEEANTGNLSLEWLIFIKKMANTEKISAET